MELPRAKDTHSHNTRRATDYLLPGHHTTRYSRKPSYMGRKIFNTLPLNLKILGGNEMKKSLQDWLMERPFYTMTEFFYSVNNWQQFVKDKLRTWRLSNLDWLWNFTGPTHVIVYEELVSHLERTLRALIEFLELPLDEAELQCAIVRREGIYKRKSRAVTLDPFTPYMKASLKAEQDFVFKEIQMYLDSA
ncbi:hypothetical protein J6590_062830 [Homalodisca vitripennis]|nr:hypothetical protein J6590_062830 [Homalodisca vitripennis]